MTDIFYKVYSVLAYFWEKAAILRHNNVAMITGSYAMPNIVLSNFLKFRSFFLDI